jgi:ABC-type glycerol-3-phosphate transport system permease component
VSTLLEPSTAASRGRLGSGTRKRGSLRRGLGQVAVQAVLITWTLIVVVPFILILLLAFRTNKDIFAYPLGFGGDFTLANFAAAWRGPVGGSGLTIYFQNTLVIAVTSLLTTLCAGLPAAFFSTTLSPRALRWFLRLFLVAAIVPLILLVIPYFQIFDRASLLNSPVMVGVTYGVIVLPTTVLILHSFFVDFPTELVEAAALDGLGPLGTFARIVLPLSKGAVFAVSLLALVFVWGESQLGIVLLQTTNEKSVAVGLLGFRGQWTAELGPIFAGLALSSIPIVVIYLCFNRYITKGIALGGVFR